MVGPMSQSILDKSPKETKMVILGGLDRVGRILSQFIQTET